MSRLKILLAAHFLLALAPLGTKIDPLHFNPVWVLFLSALIYESQLMLLSIYVGLYASNTWNKLLIALVGFIYIEIWRVVGLQSIAQGDYIVSLGCAYLVSVDAGKLIVLTAVLACARIRVGCIRRMRVLPSNSVDSRPQFSLLSLLLIMSFAAIVMALVRSSRMADSPSQVAAMVVLYTLIAIVIGFNVLAIVWSTLGLGSVLGKLSLVLAVSIMLSLSLGLGARQDAHGWGRLAYMSLITLIPYVIIAATLLLLRPLGFRLTRLAVDAIPNRADIRNETGPSIESSPTVQSK